jgi:hypothetical protein
MGYRVLSAADAFWRRSNQMKTPNTDLGKQLEASALGARMWRLEPGKASTKHRHFTQEELYVLLEGEGRVRIGEEVLTWRRWTRCWSSPTPIASSSTTPMPISFGSWSALHEKTSPARSR